MSVFNVFSVGGGGGRSHSEPGVLRAAGGSDGLLHPARAKTLPTNRPQKNPPRTTHTTFKKTSTRFDLKNI